MQTLTRFKRLTAGCMAIIMALTLGNVIAPAASAAPEIAITPSSTQVALDIGEEQTIVLSATEDGVDIGPITNDVVWSSNNESIATVTNGVIRGEAVGDAIIRAVYMSSHSVIIYVTVNPVLERIEVFDSSSIELAMGSTAYVMIKGHYSNETTRSIETLGTWTSSDDSVVTASDGILTPVGIGEADVTFAYRGKQVTLSVQVVLGVVGLWVNDVEPTILIDSTHQIEMKEIYSDESQKAVAPEQVIYIVNDPSIVSVSESGLITALAEGETVILAMYGLLTPVEITVTVVPAPTVVRLSIVSTNLSKGAWLYLALPVVTAHYSDNSERTIPPDLITWNITDPTKAIIVDTPNLSIQLKEPGQTELFIAYEGVTIRVPITVLGFKEAALLRPSKEVELSISPSSLTMNVGNTRTLSASVRYEDSNAAPVSATELTFSSSNSNVVAVNNNGELTAVSAGTATITVRRVKAETELTATLQVVVQESKSRVYTFPTEPTPNRPLVVNADIINPDAMRRVLENGDNNPPATFIDPLPEWGSEFISRATRMGIISGYADGTFQADKAITRAEFANIVSVAFGLASKEGFGFTDTEKHWAAKAIEGLRGSGVISGYADGSFQPDQPITRAEMVSILSRLTRFLPSSGGKFADTKEHWAGDAINAFGDAGIINGKGEGRFDPDGEATRAESVKIIISLLDALTNKQELPDELSDV